MLGFDILTQNSPNTKVEADGRRGSWFASIISKVFSVLLN
jgi:hypothetical protein